MLPPDHSTLPPLLIVEPARTAVLPPLNSMVASAVFSIGPAPSMYSKCQCAPTPGLKVPPGLTNNCAPSTLPPTLKGPLSKPPTLYTPPFSIVNESTKTLPPPWTNVPKFPIVIDVPVTDGASDRPFLNIK